jgi:cell division septal protein FtsQ
MKGHKSAFPIKAVLALAISCALLLVLLYLGHLLKDLGLFKIKYIISKEDSQIELSHLKGSNIFEIDLRKESKRLESLYPGHKTIKLVRVLPDRIFVDFIERRPIAYLKLYRYFCVDDSSVLFDLPGQTQVQGIPFILGLERKIYNPRPGLRVNLRVLKEYQIKAINVPSLNNASLFIASGLEVKISQDDISDKISVLGSLLNQERNGLDKIRYIDLRFKEPVIKLKNAD